LHCMIPSLKMELKNELFKLDNAFSVIHIAHTQEDGSYYRHARILLKDTCFDDAHLFHNDNCYPYYDFMLAKTYPSRHVLYCYSYIIGYSIDDLVGVNPITCASFFFCDCTFRILLVHHSSRPNLVRVDIPWDPGGCMVW
jgi:hypothetical protein